jgi:hypothetical protein
VVWSNPNNHAPLFEDVTFVLTDPKHGDVIGTLAGSDEDQDALSYEITFGNVDGAFSLDPQTGILTVADVAKLGSVAERNLTVEATDGLAVTEATVSIDIVTALESDATSSIKVYPLPAKENLNVYIPAHLRVLESSLVDISGSTVLSCDVTSEIPLTGLKQGLYFLRVNTDRGLVNLRVVVIK